MHVLLPLFYLLLLYLGPEAGKVVLECLRVDLKRHTNLRQEGHMTCLGQQGGCHNARLAAATHLVDSCLGNWFATYDNLHLCCTSGLSCEHTE